MDKIGMRTMLLFSAITVAVGQGIFGIGVTLSSFGVSVFARAILGVGNQSLNMAQAVFVVKWLVGKELSMSFGVIISTTLMSIALDANTQPGIVQISHSLDLAVWIAFLFCLLSLIFVFLVIRIDRRRDSLLGLDAKAVSLKAEKFTCRDIKKFRFIFWLLLSEILWYSGVCFRLTVSQASIIKQGLGTVPLKREVL